MLQECDSSVTICSFVYLTDSWPLAGLLSALSGISWVPSKECLVNEGPGQGATWHKGSVEDAARVQREQCLILVGGTRRRHDGGRAGDKVEESVRLCFPFVAFTTGCHYLSVWLSPFLKP